MINSIIKLASLVMVVDNDLDDKEMELFQTLPHRMMEHLEERAGVNLVITIGAGNSRRSKTSQELNEESDHNRSRTELAKIANETIQTYNELDDDEVSAWIKSIAEGINGKWVRFHTMKALVDMAAADKEMKTEELDLIFEVTKIWDCLEDTLDFLFLATRREWIEENGIIKRKLKK